MCSGLHAAGRYRKGKHAQRNATGDQPRAAGQTRIIMTRSGGELFVSAGAFGQTVEHGVEQRTKARALIEVGENSAGLLLERAVANFAGSTIKQRPHAVLGRLHVKLQSKNSLTYRKRLSLGNFALGEQH